MGSRNNKPGRIVKGTAKQPNLKDASGIWTLDEAMQAHRANAWPQPNLFQPVGNSLRLKTASSTALVKQVGRPGNQRTWTWSGWLKFSGSSGTRDIFNGSPSGSAFSGVRMIDGQIYIQDYSSGSYNIWWVSTALYRDTSAWYHIVVKYDTTQTQGNAAILYVNGVQQTLTFAAATGAYAQNRASWVNATNTQQFGQGIAGTYYDGQIGEVNFVDGYAVDPSLFGKLDSNNTWVPVPYTGSYGTNGFYLPFNNATTSQTLGYDASLTGTAIYDADQDPYRGNVALHLTGNGPAGGNNNVFADSSTNNRAITRGGTATQGSFSPFPMQANTPYNPSVHGASGYFNGSSDYLSIASDPSIGTQDFTVECWVYANSTAVTGGSNPRVFDVGGAQLVIEDTGKICRLDLNNSTSLYVSSSNVFQLNQWTHIAVVRISNAISFYLNGVAQIATSSSADLIGGTGYIGVYRGGTVGFWNGYISGLRFTIGKGIYTAAFTPTNRPFGTLTNNLIAFSEDFANSGWGKDGGISVTPNYAVAPDGTPSMTLMTRAAGSLGNWAALTWANFVGTGNNAGKTYTFSVWVQATSGTVSGSIAISDVSYNTSTTAFTATTTPQRVSLTYGGPSGTWNASSAYIGGGVNLASVGTSVLVWGAQLEVASSATNYTPTPANFSTAPSLLLNFANAAVVDTAGAGNAITYSGATITSASKYGSGAMTYNGTSDWIAVNSGDNSVLTPGTKDFTVEYWMNTRTGNDGYRRIVSSNIAGFTGGTFCMRHQPGDFQFGPVNVGNSTYSPNFTLNTWTHVAYSRRGATGRGFINGRQVVTCSDTTNYTEAIQYIGAHYALGGEFFNGSLDDVRITMGVARYQADFTPPGRALPAIGGKSFVTTNINAGVVKTFTTTGTTSWTAPVDVTQVEVLVVAGGGGGANYNSAGGGGAGGLIYNNAYPVTPGQTYTVTVGAGGAGGGTLGDSGSAALGASTSGGNSVFGALIAIGGGNGGQGNVQGSRTADQNPSAGGSGGGARGSSPYNVGGAGTGGQGFAGGNSGSYATNYPGGGGGGAGGAGGNGVSDTTAGNGGVGLQFGISGTTAYYAGGGGGSTQNTGTNSTGGLGGGGAGGSGSGGSFRDGVSGTANTGGGGGAGGFQPQYGVTGLGGNGGSGIVIVRYTTTAVANTSDATTDNLVDSPTQYGHDTGAGGEVVGNYATLNPLVLTGGAALSNGNLTITGASAYRTTPATIAMTSGKWYWENRLVTFNPSTDIHLGVCLGNFTSFQGTWVLSTAFGWGYTCQGGYGYTNNTLKNISSSVRAAGDTIGLAFDADAGNLYAYVNGVVVNGGSPIYTGLTSGPYFPFVTTGDSTGSVACNFGQRAWAYTPPAGYNALTTKNLPRLTIGSAAAAPNQFFDAVTYTGNGTNSPNALTVSSLNFQPDLIWIKNRGTTDGHWIQDTVRGLGSALQSNTTGIDLVTGGGDVSSVTSTGFVISYANSRTNASTNTYVAWCWRAGGAAVANTSGTISSQVSANTTSGFSIVTYTGTGVNATVGHGLGVAPSMYICKRRNSTSPWRVYHTSLSYTTYINLSDSGSSATDSSVWNSAPTTSVFGIGTNDMNTNTGTYVAYCWAEVPGFSKFGSYVGNGSADGPFVYTGFRPAFILTKDITTGSYWWEMVDSARAPFNPSDKTLYANVSDSEYTSSGYNKDLLSNGFKIRGTNGGHNTSGSTYIYMAFAGKPFGNINGTAR